MFDDFQQTGDARAERRRLGPLVAAVLLYGGIAAAAIAATAYVKTTVDEEQLLQVAFAPPAVEHPPEPAPPPPPPAPPLPVARPRPAAQRANAARGRPRDALEAPTEIPRGRLDESDAPLADAPPVADPGDVGTPDGTGDAPESRAPPRPSPRSAPPPTVPRPVRLPEPVQIVEQLTPARILPGNRPPPYPETARRAGLQGIVLARVTIDPDGNVTAVQILRGDTVFAEVVRSALAEWRYTPARDGDGRAVVSTKIVRIPFRLST